MRRKRNTVRHVPLAQAVPRRELLKSLGALAVSAPALAALGCSDEAGAGMQSSGVLGGTGGLGGAGASATTSALPGGASGAGSGGTGGSPATGGSIAPQPGAGAGGAAGSLPSGGSSGAAGPAGSGGVGAGAGGAGGAGSSATAGTGGMIAMPPMFEDVARCTLTGTDIEGPFYIDDGEFPDDVSLVRSDIREGLSGAEFRFHFRLLDARDDCAPIPDAELYIWHCNADGYYSGFDGQDPTMPYMGSANPTPMNDERFCRGVQISNSDGIASFITVYPGWYAGRPIHVHLLARLRGATTRLITTQLYFPAAFTTEVHEAEPAYMARAASIPAGSRNPPAGNPVIPTLTHTPGLVVGTLNVIVNRG